MSKIKLSINYKKKIYRVARELENISLGGKKIKKDKNIIYRGVNLSAKKIIFPSNETVSPIVARPPLKITFKPSRFLNSSDRIFARYDYQHSQNSKFHRGNLGGSRSGSPPIYARPQSERSQRHRNGRTLDLTGNNGRNGYHNGSNDGTAFRIIRCQGGVSATISK